MARIKVTGYINTEDLDPSQVDLNHETGLSGVGYDELILGESGLPLSIADLEDVDTEVE